MIWLILWDHNCIAVVDFFFEEIILFWMESLKLQIDADYSSNGNGIPWNVLKLFISQNDKLWIKSFAQKWFHLLIVNTKIPCTRNNREINAQ